MKILVKNADDFIVKRKSNNLSTIIAGFPWFLDWGRDSMLSFEGLLLKTNRFELAKEVILTYVSSIEKGLVPNGFSEYDDTPLYNSVDASLLLFEVISKYLAYTNDYDFIFDNVFKKLKDIIRWYEFGTLNDIYLCQDGLISCGNEKTQLTWMDAQAEGRPVTPRSGKVVEVNALWYNALNIISKLCDIKGEDKRHYKNLANKCKKSFVEKFYNNRKRYLLDTLDDDRIRPNALFATSLSYPIVKGKIAKEIIYTTKEKLLTNKGLRTLAPCEKDYSCRYEGNGNERDKVYHQGTVWPWLWGLYYDSLLNIYKDEIENKEKVKHEIKDFKKFIGKNVNLQLREGCINSISEIYDADEPRLPKGCFAQAWSVAQAIKILG